MATAIIMMRKDIAMALIAIFPLNLSRLAMNLEASTFLQAFLDANIAKFH